MSDLDTLNVKRNLTDHLCVCDRLVLTSSGIESIGGDSYSTRSLPTH